MSDAARALARIALDAGGCVSIPLHELAELGVVVKISGYREMLRIKVDERAARRLPVVRGESERA